MATILGVGAITARLTGLAAAGRQAIAAALYVEGQDILRESRDRVPVDTSALKNSGFADVPAWVTPGLARVTVGFGGPAAEYAVIVHEDLEAHHDVGGPKYLESVILEHAPGFADRIAARVRQQLGT